MAVELLDVIQKAFALSVSNDREINAFLKMVRNKNATLGDVYEYSRKLGKISGTAMADSVNLEDPIYFKENADVIIPLILNQNHKLVITAAEEVQKIADKKDGLTLGAIKSKIDNAIVNDIVRSVSEDTDTAEGIRNILIKQSETFSEKTFDKFIKDNVAFRYDSGMNPQIIRTYEGMHREHTNHKDGGNMADCEWCKNLAGVYDYEDVRGSGNDVFRRHEGCHCTVVYKNNRTGYLQNAHSKKMITK